MKLRTILLFGSPGAGKGTQGKILGKIPNYLHISSGDLFRNLRIQNPIGQLFLDYASHGNLVPDEPTINLWKDDIENRSRNGQFNPETDTLLLDGIPRNVNQAKLLENIIHTIIDTVLLLKITLLGQTLTHARQQNILAYL